VLTQNTEHTYIHTWHTHVPYTGCMQVVYYCILYKLKIVIYMSHSKFHNHSGIYVTTVLFQWPQCYIVDRSE